ncbi:MAG: PAS domain-containing sensor histidine kinase [Rickettsiales bacterium]|nr:PAS domain-containing sensor histidine kinase [Rickettsiales bacterium]
MHIWNSFWKQWGLPQSEADTLPPLDTPLPRAYAPASSHDGLTPQEKYDFLSEYGSHILCLVQKDVGCTYLSRNFESITGLPCAEQMGKPLSGLVHPDFHERLAAVMDACETQHILRCKLKHADGKWYWYQFLIHPRSEGKAGELVCVVESIHEHVSAQNTLQKARLEAELALRARSEFLANMSHELRTPLNAVIGFSQIIESEIFGKIDNPQYMEYIRHIQESGYDLLAKIEDLLEIANIDAGRVTLSKEEVYASDILQHVLESQSHHANAARISLFSEPSEEDSLLYVDRLKLQHIMGHLVSNAIKFSSAGGSIALSARACQTGLDFYVRDRGAGMSPDKLAAITTALLEDNCWSSANENSTIGLGLALTREFVALHGGQVQVESRLNEGTTIIIALPKECVRATMRHKTQESMDFLLQAVP